MIGFEIITKRPEKWSFALYKKYRAYQNAVLRDYLKGQQANKEMHSFLLNTAPYGTTKLISKIERKISGAPDIRTDKATQQSLDQRRHRIVKIIAWIFIATVFGIAIISQL